MTDHKQEARVTERDTASALRAAQAIEDERTRAYFLGNLAPHLPQPLLAEALQAAQAIEYAWARAYALDTLVPHLPEPLLAEALQAARAIRDEWRRGDALGDPRLPDEQRQALLAEALQAVRAIRDERGRARALGDLAPHLPQPLLAEALRAARTIENDWDRAEVLGALPRHLPHALFDKALQAARAIKGEWPRACALAALAQHLPEEQRPTVLAEAVQAARGIRDEHERAAALGHHAPYLPESLLAYCIRLLSTPVASPLPSEVPVARATFRALQAARAIEDKKIRTQALLSLLHRTWHLPEEYKRPVLAQALQTAVAIKDEHERAAVLSCLAPHLPEPLLASARQAARAIKDEEARAIALRELHWLNLSIMRWATPLSLISDARPLPAENAVPPETSPGRLVFNLAHLMKVGRRERIEVRLSRDLAAKLTEDLRGRGAPQIEAIEIAERMRVRLLGDHFAIEALSSEDQVVREFGFAQWDFDVVPLRSGRRILRLLVTLRLKREGDQELCDLPALEREIVVQVAPVYAVAFFTRTHWKWLCASIVIPLIVWLASGLARYVDVLFKP